MPKIRFKRGLKTNLPILDEGEPAFTTDTEEFFIGSKDGNIEIAKYSDLPLVSMADLVTINNHTITYGYDANGNVQTVTEKDSSNNTIKTVTYTYDSTTGNVTSSVTVMNGKTVTTTYNYDSNGNITSTSNVIS